MCDVQSTVVFIFVFLIGMNCAILENSTEYENENETIFNDRCVQECGRDPNITCVGDLMLDGNLTCGCREETDVYLEKSQLCVGRCAPKCGDDPEVYCKGNQTTDETTVCSCKAQTMTYDAEIRKCVAWCHIKCGNSSDNIQCYQTSNETTVCGCREAYQFYDDKSMTCKDRCSVKCGHNPFVRCSGDQDSEDTTICGCSTDERVFVNETRRCKDRCSVKCGNNPYVRCVGYKTSDETTNCRCSTDERVFVKENKTCIDRCTIKCGRDWDIKCRGDLRNDETIVCDCWYPDRIYDRERKKCIVDWCASNPCKNGGTCISSEDNFECTCTEVYEGKDCSENVWCDKHGQDLCGWENCQYNETLGGGYCVCENGEVFDEASKWCMVDHCASSPCKNGGSCKNGKYTFECTCTGTYGGKNCSENIWCVRYGKLLCAREKCQYNETQERVHCVCENGKVFNWTSKTCIGVCTINPCRNGGTCEKHGNTHNCICRENFFGTACQISPCTNNPCRNGGTCYINGNTHNCICGDGFWGKTCQIDKRVLLALLLLLLPLAAVVLSIVSKNLCVSKTNKKYKNIFQDPEIYKPSLGALKTSP